LHKRHAFEHALPACAAQQIAPVESKIEALFSPDLPRPIGKLRRHVF
jgi:hypothetical protein